MNTEQPPFEVLCPNKIRENCLLRETSQNEDFREWGSVLENFHIQKVGRLPRVSLGKMI